MTHTLFTCTKCNKIFRSHNRLDYHNRCDHQLSVKVKFHNGEVTEVTKDEEDLFKCKCGKGFKLPVSLQRHGKNCRGDLIAREDNEKEAIFMDVDDFDASESVSVDDRVIPFDCIGTQIFS